MSAALNAEHVGNNSVPEVDDLVPTKPIKDFVEFGTNSMRDVNENPDYVFRVNDLRRLVHHETELMGKEFPLPGLNCSAQIKCDVSYDHFQLSIRFLDPEKSGQSMNIGLKTMKLFTIIQNPNQVFNCNEELVHEFPFLSQLIYGTFAPISTLSYAENLQNTCNKSTNSVTLHLHVRVATEDMFLDDGIWLWKVNVSGQLRSSLAANKVKELGLSPFLHTHPDGLRVQIRLYLQNDNCLVESRVVNRNGQSVPFVINMYIIHPTDSTRPRLTTSLDFRNWALIKLSQPRYLHVQEFAGKRELVEYASEGKLLVKVEIKPAII